MSGVEIFYREAGPSDAPVVLLPHGYPSSSFQYRALLPALAGEWRLLAPDFPGFGYSEAPPDFDYSFPGYADLPERFLKAPDAELHLFEDGGHWLTHLDQVVARIRPFLSRVRAESGPW